MFESAIHEWHDFRDDSPGRRFTNHHERTHKSASRGKDVARVAIGLGLIIGGIVLLFIPGPGMLLILFGVALFAGQSQRLAALLDRGEVWARDRWRRMSHGSRVALIAASSLVAAVTVTLVGIRFVF